MAGDLEDEVFCEREQRNFPRNEFEIDPAWGLVHNVQPLHTKEGTIVNRSRDVPQPDAIPRDLEL
jgi:hypothetical protein